MWWLGLVKLKLWFTYFFMFIGTSLLFLIFTSFRLVNYFVLPMKPRPSCIRWQWKLRHEWRWLCPVIICYVLFYLLLFLLLYIILSTFYFIFYSILLLFIIGCDAKHFFNLIEGAWGEQPDIESPPPPGRRWATHQKILNKLTHSISNFRVFHCIFIYP